MNRYKLSCILWACIQCFVFSDNVYLLNTSTYKTLKLHFPFTEINAISTFDMAQLTEETRPSLWPKRIPFVAGIATNEKKGFYYHYETIGFSKLNIIESTSHLSDIAVTSKGHIFTLEETQNKLTHYRYNVKEKSLNIISDHHIPNPIKMDINKKNKCIIINKNECLVYQITRKHKIKPLKRLMKTINDALDSNELLVNASITNKNDIIILSENYIYFFNFKGKVIKKIPNTHNFNLIDSTTYSDILIGSTETQIYQKFNNKGVLLTPILFDRFKTSPPQDMVIYKPYGNIALFNLSEGRYYTMGTELTINNIATKETQNTFTIETTFTTTFPSYVSVYLKNKKEKKILLEEKKLLSNTHDYTFKNIPNTYENSTIYFSAKAVYSKSNKSIKSKNLTKNNSL